MNLKKPFINCFQLLTIPYNHLRYMGHPNAKVARYTHTVFVAFMTSGKDLNQSERDLLKEQLVYYYIHRSLEVLILLLY